MCLRLQLVDQLERGGVVRLRRVRRAPQPRRRLLLSGLGVVVLGLGADVVLGLGAAPAAAPAAPAPDAPPLVLRLLGRWDLMLTAGGGGGGGAGGGGRPRGGMLRRGGAPANIRNIRNI